MKKIYLVSAFLIGSLLCEAQIFKKKKKVVADTDTSFVNLKEVLAPEQEVLESRKNQKQTVGKDTEAEGKAPVVNMGTSTPIEGKDEADLSKRSLSEFGFRLAGNYLQSKMSNFSTPQLTASGLPVLTNGKIERDAFSLSDELQLGGTVAVFYRVSKGAFFFQPEIAASLKGGMVQNSNTTVNSNPIDARYISIDFAPIVGLRSGNLRLSTGPIASYAIQHQTKLIDAFQAYSLTVLPKSAFEPYGLNYQFGFGYDIGLWELDARYEFGLKPISKIALGTANIPSEFNYTSGMFQFSIGRVLWNRVK